MVKAPATSTSWPLIGGNEPRLKRINGEGGTPRLMPLSGMLTGLVVTFYFHKIPDELLTIKIASERRQRKDEDLKGLKIHIAKTVQP